MSTSQATLLADLVKEYGLGRAGTATSATTTTVVDASHFGGPIPGGVFPNGSPIRITSGAAAGGNSYKSGAIDPATGTVTFSPAVAGNTGTPTFVISTVVEHIDRLIEAMNRALTRRCTRQYKTPLTDIPDGDFMGATASDHWAVSNATQAYVTLTMQNGVAQRCLAVTDTSLGTGYTQSDAIKVEPLETRNGMVWMRNANATPTTSNIAQIVIRDLTNGQNITPQFLYGSATTTSRAFTVVQFTYAVPAGCSEVAWRLASATTSGVVQFANAIDNGYFQRTFNSQPHLRSEDDISAWYRITVAGDQTPLATNISYVPISDDGVSVSDYGWGMGIEWDAYPGFPLFYDELSFFPALTSDSDTTDCDEELLLCGTAIELYEMLTNESQAAPSFYRGKILPTATMLKLQNAKDKWRSPRLQRLLAPRRVQIRRDYKTKIWA